MAQSRTHDTAQMNLQLQMYHVALVLKYKVGHIFLSYLFNNFAGLELKSYEKRENSHFW